MGSLRGVGSRADGRSCCGLTLCKLTALTGRCCPSRPGPSPRLWNTTATKVPRGGWKFAKGGLYIYPASSGPVYEVSHVLKKKSSVDCEL